MYVPLIDQFRGAFLGCAIAERMADVPPALTEALVEQGSKIDNITVSLDMDIDADLKDSLQALTRTILVSLLCNDSPTERERALHNNSPALKELSGVISARLQGQMPGLSPEHVILTTIKSMIQQHLPLQDALQLLMTGADGSPLDQAIAIALYCWRCTPNQFNISVGRSRLSWQYLSSVPGLGLVPGLTGLIAGLSTGSSVLSNTNYPANDLSQKTATHLFQVWAGLSTAHLAPRKLETAVITQLGTLKPRTTEHLTLNSDYD